jgi:hypothetical protein
VIKGRCCGCGFESRVRKRLKAHIVVCPGYADLVHHRPSRVKPPYEELQWWRDGLAEIHRLQVMLETQYLAEKLKERV